MVSGVGARNPTHAIRILTLVVESGVLYVLIGVSSASVPHTHRTSWTFFSLQVVTLATVFIPNILPYGALGDIFMPVSVQLAVRNSSRINHRILADSIF
jgi:hypothetical protein